MEHVPVVIFSETENMATVSSSRSEGAFMSVSRMSAGAVTVAATAVIGLGGAAPAIASEQWGINGTFATSSNGEWAKINDRYENQPSTRSNWTITTQCISPTECSGTVNSD